MNDFAKLFWSLLLGTAACVTGISIMNRIYTVGRVRGIMDTYQTMMKVFSESTKEKTES